MVFNSWSFIIFYLIIIFATVLVTKFCSKASARNTLLLIASYWFYASFSPVFLLLLFYTTTVNYTAGIVMTPNTRQGKYVAGFSIACSLLPLVTFKYLGFLAQSFNGIFNTTVPNPAANWLLPVGISFFTFQALSYTIDVYRGKLSSTKNLLDFSLFVAFFPTVLSGPIEKARNLLPQIQRANQITLQTFAQGFSIFIWGLFKKMVVADRLSSYVDSAYSHIDYSSGSTLALAAVFYSIQIYCDFSGYSDMALGIGRGLGFKLTWNFRHPYFSKSIKDFWHKWHISLTSWFTEYVYISLGGNKVTKLWWILNIAAIFLLSGIWHGAALGFLVWGALHALLYLTEHTLGWPNKQKTNIFASISGGAVVFASITLAWIFFRLPQFDTAYHAVSKIFCDWSLPFSAGASAFSFLVTLAGLFMFIVYEILIYKRVIKLMDDDFVPFRPAILLWLLSLILAIELLGQSNEQFVYFQF